MTDLYTNKSKYSSKNRILAKQTTPSEAIKHQSRIFPYKHTLYLFIICIIKIYNAKTNLIEILILFIKDIFVCEGQIKFRYLPHGANLYTDFDF